MIHDAYTTFCKAARPVITPGAAIQTLGLPTVAATNSIDLQVAMDLGQGTPLVLRFEVTEAFNIVGSNTLAPALRVSTDAAVSSGVEVIARGIPLASDELIAGAFIDVALPALPSLLAAGKRYLSAAIEVFVPTADWEAGAFNAFLLPMPVEGNRVKYASGYTV